MKVIGDGQGIVSERGSEEIERREMERGEVMGELKKMESGSASVLDGTAGELLKLLLRDFDRCMEVGNGSVNH